MMDPDIKAKWVAALRDPDKYKQGHGRLINFNSPGGHPLDRPTNCCLGVLAREENIEHHLWQDELLLSSVILNLTAVEQGGVQAMYAHDAYGIPKEVEEILADMNDGNEDKGLHKHTFEEIADFIEQHPEL